MHKPSLIRLGIELGGWCGSLSSFFLHEDYQPASHLSDNLRSKLLKSRPIASPRRTKGGRPVPGRIEGFILVQNKDILVSDRTEFGSAQVDCIRPREVRVSFGLRRLRRSAILITQQSHDALGFWYEKNDNGNLKNPNWAWRQNRDVIAR